MRTSGLLIIGAMLACIEPATAQPTELDVPVGKSWKHRPTGIALTPALVGLQRQSVESFGGSQTDIAGNYWSPDGKDNVTVFLFRNVSADVPVWFDRARVVISELPEKYGKVTGTGARSFTPRGQRTASALLETYLTTKRARSTAIAVMPISGFYAKIRASSETQVVDLIAKPPLSVAGIWGKTDRQISINSQ